MNRWFITQYEQIQLTDGFRIEFYTDVPCHLYIYWTTYKPWVHRVAGDRRGLLFKFFEYFCFVSWTKQDQSDPGDTLFHSFTLDNWPFCETRWFVFYGTIAGEPSPSVSPIFEKHNDYIPPPPFHWVASTHELLNIARVLGWQDILWTDNTPLKDHLPSDTIALCLHIRNDGATKPFGLRKKGSTHNITGNALVLSQQWAVVGVNNDIEAQAYSSGLNPVVINLEGYVLSNGAVIFTNPYDKTPTGDLTWETVNLADICPDATGIIAEIEVEPIRYPSGIRKTGSTDNRTDYVRHIFATIGCNSSQQIDFYALDRIGRKGHLYICGYITDHASFYTNALDKSPSILDTWQTITVAKPSNLAFFEITSPTSGDKFALRAIGADHFFDRRPNPRHSFAIIPVDIPSDLEGRIDTFNLKFHQVGEGH